MTIDNEAIGDKRSERNGSGRFRFRHFGMK